MSIDLSAATAKTKSSELNAINAQEVESVSSSFTLPDYIKASWFHSGTIDFAREGIAGIDGVGLNQYGLYGVASGTPVFLLSADTFENDDWGQVKTGELRFGDDVRQTSSTTLAGNSYVWFDGTALRFKGVDIELSEGNYIWIGDTPPSGNAQGDGCGFSADGLVGSSSDVPKFILFADDISDAYWGGVKGEFRIGDLVTKNGVDSTHVDYSDNLMRFLPTVGATPGMFQVRIDGKDLNFNDSGSQTEGVVFYQDTDISPASWVLSLGIDPAGKESTSVPTYALMDVLVESAKAQFRGNYVDLDAALTQASSDADWIEGHWFTIDDSDGASYFVTQTLPTTSSHVELVKSGGGSGDVASVFSRTGVVVAATNDYTWAQIDKTTSDIEDITTRSHTKLTDVGTTTHVNIDTHIADNTKHFLQGDISIPASQISDFDTEVSNNTSVVANSAKDANVSTTLEIGTRTATTLGITSDGGADDVVLPAANTTQAGLMTDAQFDKLDSIEDSAKDDQTASEILTLVKTVDGSGSGLDADTLDGYHASELVTSINSIDIALTSEQYLNVNSRIPNTWGTHTDNVGNIFSFSTSDVQATMTYRESVVIGIHDYDTSTVSGEATDQKRFANGLRVGAVGGTAVNYSKDVVGIIGSGTANTRQGYAARGASGCNGEANQYGYGVATNEFWAVDGNDDGSGKATQLSPMICVLYPRQNWDHAANYSGESENRSYDAITASNNNSTYTARTALITVGKFQTGLDLYSATIVGSSLRMPYTSTGIIEYAAGDYTNYSGDTYYWHINNQPALGLGAQSANMILDLSSSIGKNFGSGTSVNSGIKFGSAVSIGGTNTTGWISVNGASIALSGSSGNIIATGFQETPTSNSQVATKGYVDTQILTVSGVANPLTSNLTINSFKLLGSNSASLSLTGTADTSYVAWNSNSSIGYDTTYNRMWVDAEGINVCLFYSTYLDMQNHKITGLALTPTVNSDAASKYYVDTYFTKDTSTISSSLSWVTSTVNTSTTTVPTSDAVRQYVEDNASSGGIDNPLTAHLNAGSYYLYSSGTTLTLGASGTSRSKAQLIYSSSLTEFLLSGNTNTSFNLNSSVGISTNNTTQLFLNTSGSTRAIVKTDRITMASAPTSLTDNDLITKSYADTNYSGGSSGLTNPLTTDLQMGGNDITSTSDFDIIPSSGKDIRLMASANSWIKVHDSNYITLQAATHIDIGAQASPSIYLQSSSGGGIYIGAGFPSKIEMYHRNYSGAYTNIGNTSKYGQVRLYGDKVGLSANEVWINSTGGALSFFGHAVHEKVPVSSGASVGTLIAALQAYGLV